MNWSKIAKFCRKMSFPGKDRLLRTFYSPDNRQNDYVTEIIEYDGGFIRVNTSTYLEWYLYVNKYYEPHVTKIIKSVVTDDSVCIDVGANIGCHTLIMANSAKHGIVYAFEPHPAIFERLIFNINLNKLSNVVPCNVAIASETGESYLFIPDDSDCNKGKCSMISSNEGKIMNKLKINTSKYQDINELANIKRCDFIKIDVEGYELICLKEFEPLINEFKPIIIFEYDSKTWKLAGSTLEEVYDILDQYNITDIQHGQPLSMRMQQDASVDALCRPK
jgi:FkbM family methyltransferase